MGKPKEGGKENQQEKIEIKKIFKNLQKKKRKVKGIKNEKNQPEKQKISNPQKKN